MTRTSFRISGVILAAVMALAIATPAMAADSSKAPRPGPSLKVGDTAPDFKLQYFDGHELKNVSLSDFRGKQNVVLAFYVFAFTGG